MQAREKMVCMSSHQNVVNLANIHNVPLTSAFSVQDSAGQLAYDAGRHLLYRRYRDLRSSWGTHGSSYMAGLYRGVERDEGPPSLYR